MYVLGEDEMNGLLNSDVFVDYAKEHTLRCDCESFIWTDRAVL